MGTGTASSTYLKNLATFQDFSSFQVKFIVLLGHYA